MNIVTQELGGKITRQPGPIPGLNTKITSFLDPDGWKVVSPMPGNSSSNYLIAFITIMIMLSCSLSSSSTLSNIFLRAL